MSTQRRGYVLSMAQRSDRGGNKYGTDELFVDVVVLAAIFDECVRELFLGKEKGPFP